MVEHYEGFTIVVGEPHLFAESWSMKVSVQESICSQETGQYLSGPTISFSFGGYFPTKEVASTRALVAAQKLIGQLVAMGRL